MQKNSGQTTRATNIWALEAQPETMPVLYTLSGSRKSTRPTVTSNNSAPASSWQLLSPAASTANSLQTMTPHTLLWKPTWDSYTFPTMTPAANLPTVSVTPMANFPLVLLTLVVLLDLRISLQIIRAHWGLCHIQRGTVILLWLLSTWAHCCLCHMLR